MLLHLLPSASRITADEVLALRPAGVIVACDFYVEGIACGQAVVGGYLLGRILNVDHHAPTRAMMRPVSSANLALERVRSEPLEAEDLVVINHTDCDSILTAGILTGRLPDDERFGEAAVAADHSGAANAIADLLQGLDSLRDVETSFRNLEALLQGRPLEPGAAGALDRRLQKRQAAAEAVGAGRLRMIGPLAVGVLDESIDGEFFPPLLPSAAAILLASRMAGRRRAWQIKLRLGLAAPEGLSLHDLRIPEFDPAYGGRWNAGSNKRGGGTTIEPGDYAEAIAARLAHALANLRSDHEPANIITMGNSDR